MSKKITPIPQQKKLSISTIERIEFCNSVSNELSYNDRVIWGDLVLKLALKQTDLPKYKVETLTNGLTTVGKGQVHLIELTTLEDVFVTSVLKKKKEDSIKNNTPIGEHIFNLIQRNKI